ncbi:MntP/YtaF family protein [Rathayibacter sp. CAU 1779]
MEAEIPAGWYPNPWNDAEELYWSGTEWTGISRAVHRTASVGQGASAESQVEESTIMRPVAGHYAANGATPGGIVPPSFGADSVAPVAPVVSQYAAPQPIAPQYAAPQPVAPQYIAPAPAPYVPQTPVGAPSAASPDASAFAPISQHVEQSYPTVPYSEMQRRDSAAAYSTPEQAQQHASAQQTSAQPYAPPYAQQSYAQQTYAAPPTYSAPPAPDASGPALLEASGADPIAETQYRQLPDAGQQRAGLPAAASGYPTDPGQPDDLAYPDPADAATIRWALGDSAPARPAPNPRARFGVIAMIAGIVAAVFSFLPILSFAAWIPAFAAIAFGIISYLGGKPRAFALTGIIAGGAALAVGTGVSIWYLVTWGTLAH